MNLGVTFTTYETPDRTRQLVGDYLQRAGYKPVGSGPVSVYRRGSKLGSLIGFSAKGWQATVTLQIAPGEDEATRVTASFDVDTSGQMVIKRERKFWENELDALVAAVGGTNRGVPALVAAEETVRRDNRMRSGANWFYLIAGLSLLNSLMIVLNFDYYFFVGLGITQIVDGIAIGLVPYVTPEVATFVRIAALVVDVLIAGLFALFGYLANRGHRWSFVVGGGLYALDALIFLMVPDLMSIGFHILGLVIIFMGLQSARKPAEVEPELVRPAF
jgi:hypothetical protein